MARAPACKGWHQLLRHGPPLFAGGARWTHTHPINFAGWMGHDRDDARPDGKFSLAGSGSGRAGLRVGFGSGSGRARARVWVGFGSGSGRAGLRVRVGLGSGSGRVWVGSGSGRAGLRVGLGSGRVGSGQGRVEFGVGWGDHLTHPPIAH
jgi:hypothetical protein